MRETLNRLLDWARRDRLETACSTGRAAIGSSASLPKNFDFTASTPSATPARLDCR
jgi:hypothetical protein